jgi:hypothetical protein
MKHIWSILCRSSQIDIDTNNLSISNVFEQLAVTVDQPNVNKPSEPINIPLEYEVVSLWTRQDLQNKTESEVVLDIVDPKGNTLKSFSQTATMPAKMKRLRTRFRIQGLGLTTSGIYKFIIKLKEADKNTPRKVSEIPLEVQIKPRQIKGQA